MRLESLEIGSVLVEEGVLTSHQLEVAQRRAEKEGCEVGAILVAMGQISEDDVARAKGKKLGYRYVDLMEEDIDFEGSACIPVHLVSLYKALPIRKEGNKLIVAMADPLPIAIDDLRWTTGLEIEPVIATQTSILGMIDAYRVVEEQFGDHNSGLLVKIADFIRSITRLLSD